MEILYKITITCFAASYLFALGLEISRVFFRFSFRRPILIGFAVAGLVAHTIHLFAQGLLEVTTSGIWISNWTAWCFTVAWLLASAYLWVSLRKHESVVGIFLLPVVIFLIALGMLLRGSPSFSISEAKSGWNLVHGYSLMLGTVSVALGFVFGLVYLVQAYRLKRKLPQSERFQLPSLEWLQRCCERSLMASLILLAIGLVSGIAMNFLSQSSVEGRSFKVAWTDPVVWSSAILFFWLLMITLFNRFYQPVKQGRKVAYLMVCCFLFLIFELAIVWIAGHAASEQQPAQKSSVANSTQETDSDQKPVSFGAEPLIEREVV